MENNQQPYSVTEKLNRTRYYMGGYWTFLATGKETNGQFALMEVNLRKGLEPPEHTHTNEDESFHVLEGEIQFTVANENHTLKAGDFLHIPKGVPHFFKVQSDTVKMLSQVVPAGLEEFFIELSRPADALNFPSIPPGPPSAEVLQKIGALQQQYGIIGIDNSKVKAL